MAETPEKKAQYWCFDGSSWRLIDDPMPDLTRGQDAVPVVLRRRGGFNFCSASPNMTAPHISLWTRGSKPECVIEHLHGGRREWWFATVYADRVPDGIDLFTRWAPAICRHGSEPSRAA